MYPTLKGKSTVKQVTDTFYGYNHNLKIGDGEFYECENMTTDYYPLAACSRKRTEVELIKAGIYRKIHGIICNGTKIYYVTQFDGQDKAYLQMYGHAGEDDGSRQEKELELTAGEKQLVNMGAYICVFPDGAYYNTQDSKDYGYMGCTWDYSTTDALKSFTYETCDANGNGYDINEGGELPTNPEDGEMWIIYGAAGSRKTIYKWSAANNEWEQITEFYFKWTFSEITLAELRKKFKINDYITIGGYWADEPATIKRIFNTSDGPCIVVTWPAAHMKTTVTDSALYLIRRFPIMDYVVECQNRLWGCRYGLQPYRENTLNRTPFVNEIYCCELGNFRNWYKYEGISTDSWAASIGSGGEWTGAITFNGNPLFFKHDCVHQVTVSSQGAHRVTQISVQGVRSGSSKSLCIIQNKLYYHSATGVVEYQGGLTGKISGALGDGEYLDAIAAAKNNKLYMAMYAESENGMQQYVYVYDTIKGLWSKGENRYQWPYKHLISALAPEEIGVYGTNEIGQMYRLDDKGAGAADYWSFESGIFTYNSGSKYKSSYNGGHRYITRFDIRLKMELGAECEMYIEYDSSGTWEFAGRIKVRNTDSFMIPIRPRRCDHLRIKLKGSGDVKIYSITRNLAMGSDNP